MSQSQATAKPRTNQSRRRIAFIRKRLAPRTRDLFLDLIADKEQPSAYFEAQCLKVAELTIETEALRAKLDAMLKTNTPTDAEQVKNLSALVNATTRLESTLRRAAADLGKVAPEPEGPSWIDLQEAAERIEQAERDAKREASQ
jgi:hypothetical protein